jgi:hypothetical protein
MMKKKMTRIVQPCGEDPEQEPFGTDSLVHSPSKRLPPTGPSNQAVTTKQPVIPDYLKGMMV